MVSDVIMSVVNGCDTYQPGKFREFSMREGHIYVVTCVWENMCVFSFSFFLSVVLLEVYMKCKHDRIIIFVIFRSLVAILT